MTDEPTIPQRRQSALTHLRTAAKSSLGSQEETYCISASIAESLFDITEQLKILNKTLAEWPIK